MKVTSALLRGSVAITSPTIDEGAAVSANYPFVPKSNRQLQAGQFWAIPLPSGRFGCGRVMAVKAFGESDRVGFVAGLMDWHARELPTESDLANMKLLAQGKTRYEAISKSGWLGQVLGDRPLSAEGLVALDPDDGRVGARFQLWGWNALPALAEQILTGEDGPLRLDILR